MNITENKKKEAESIDTASTRENKKSGSKLKTNKTKMLDIIDRKIPEKIKNKKVLTAAAAVAVTLIIIILKNISAAQAQKKISVFTDETNKCSVIFSGEKMIGKPIDGELSGDVRYSVDSDCAAFLIYTQNHDESYYTLYTVKNRKITKVTNNIASGFKLSANGGAVCYTDRDGALHLYKSSSSDEIIAKSADTYCMSPNGKTVIYSAYDEAGLSYGLYLYKNGSVSEIGSGLAPAAASDSGKLIYAFSTDYKTLYTVTPDGKSKNKICDYADRGMYLTRDLSQAVFSSDSGTYICSSGKVRKLILSNAYAAPLMNETDSAACLDEKHSVYITNYDDLSDMYYEYVSQDGVKGICFMDSSFASADISGGIEYACVSKNGKTAVFTSTDKKLYKSKNGKEAKLIEEYAENVTISESGKYILFTGSDGVFCLSNSNKRVKTYDKTNSAYLTQNGTVCLTESGSESVLYTSKKGGAEKAVGEETVFAEKIAQTGAVGYAKRDKNGKIEYAVIS